MKFRIMGTDIDGNPVTDEIEIPETDTAELCARAHLSAFSAVQSDIRQRIADILKENPGIDWFQHLAKEDFDAQIDRIESLKVIKKFCDRKGIPLKLYQGEHLSSVVEKVLLTID